MPAYLDFPTLSSEAIFLHGEPTFERPNLKYDYGAGPEEVRNTTSVGRWVEIPVTLHVSTTPPAGETVSDFQKVIEFLGITTDGTNPGRGLESEPFWYTHPVLGKALVRYSSDKFKPGQPIAGSWAVVRLDLVFRGQWNA